MMQSRFMFATVILLLVSRFATAQAQSNAPLSSADLVKAVIRGELEPYSDARELARRAWVVRNSSRNFI